MTGPPADPAGWDFPPVRAQGLEPAGLLRLVELLVPVVARTPPGRSHVDPARRLVDGAERRTRVENQWKAALPMARSKVPSSAKF